MRFDWEKYSLYARLWLKYEVKHKRDVVIVNAGCYEDFSFKFDKVY